MKSFSALTLLTTGLAAFARADDAGPTANAVRTPGTGTIVKTAQPYNITWDLTPYTGGTVTLELLKGPPTNAVPIATIIKGTENDGLYTWTPDAALEVTTGDTGYGIKMTIDQNGAYQYTTQFGVQH